MKNNYLEIAINNLFCKFKKSYNKIKNKKDLLNKSIKIIKITGFILLFHFIYSIYSIYKYENIVIDKKDFKTRTIIKSRFPSDYEVNIITSDLVGLGEKFYVAYGNKSFVKNAYYLYGDSAIANINSNIGKSSIPILKFFYVKEPGLISSLFSIIPFVNIEKSLFELSIKEYASYSFIPLEDSIEKFDKNNYKLDFEFPRVFMINNMSSMDIDSDNKDEVIVNYLDYYGGSGGTKYSMIFEIIDDKLKINLGFPDLLDIEFSQFLHSLLKYSGIDNPIYRNSKELNSTIDLFSNMYNISNFDKAKLQSQSLNIEKLIPILEIAKQNSPSDTITFIDVESEQTTTLTARHTDNFSEFININGKYIYVDSYYIIDDACHWCPHYWRIMTFIYRDGRWISDRNINGNNFYGIWLDEKKPFTLNEIFGTYPDQGSLGFAYSFLNPNWTVTSKYKLSDPSGTEMRLQSPVIKKINEIYSANK